MGFVKVTQVRSTVERGKSFVQYRLRTESPKLKSAGLTWRRFSEFEKLLKDLGNLGEDISGLVLPSKVFRTGPEDRKPQLEAFINDLLGRVCYAGDISTAPEVVLDFLAIKALIVKSAVQDSSQQEYIAPAPVVPKYREQVDSAVAEVARLGKLCMGDKKLESEGWSKLGSSGPVEWYINAEKSLRLTFAVVSHSTPKMIHEIIFNSLRDFKKLEPNLKQAKELAKLGPQTKVDHFQMKSIMFLPPRDAIFIRHWRVLPSGETVYVDLSLDEFNGAPQKDTGGYVRAEQTFGGSFVSPVKNQPGRCFVLLVDNMDPRVTGIPASMESRVKEYSAGMQAKNMENLIKIVKKKQLKTYLALPALQNVQEGEKAPEIVEEAGEEEAVEEEENSIKAKLIAASPVVVLVGILLAVIFADPTNPDSTINKWMNAASR